MRTLGRCFSYNLVDLWQSQTPLFSEARFRSYSSCLAARERAAFLPPLYEVPWVTDFRRLGVQIDCSGARQARSSKHAVTCLKFQRAEWRDKECTNVNKIRVARR